MTRDRDVRSPWPRRIALALFAFGGTALYAASFAGARNLDALERIAVAVAIASAVSWPVFGALLLAASRSRPSALSWADACLTTMGAGMIFLVTGALANVALGSSLGAERGSTFAGPLHLALLLASDIVMCWLFVRRARERGMRVAVAITLWVLGLNGTFAAVMWALLRGGTA